MVFLNKALLEKAEKDLNEKADEIPEYINLIKEWIKKAPHLKCRLDEQWLLAFLRASKFSLQKAKERIDRFYTIRTLVPEYFRNRDPFSPDVQDILKKGIILPLPKTENETGPRIIMLHWAESDPDKITLTQMIKVYFMISDILMNEDPRTVISGIKLVADYKTFNTNYIFQFTPSVIKKLITCLQNVYPMRIKGIYIFNAPNIFEKVFLMGRMVMNEKLRKRAFMYSESNFDKVLDILPPSLFPKEYHGENGSIPELIAEWKKKVESYKGWYEEDEMYGTIENLRRGKPQTSADLFGVEGSFRQLNLD